MLIHGTVMKIIIANLLLSSLGIKEASKAQNLLTTIKICEIIYGEKSLDKKSTWEKWARERNKLRLKDCNQIGVEYNQQKKPLIKKPIYACCKEIKRPN